MELDSPFFEILSVTQCVELVDAILSEAAPVVVVRGEVSNLTFSKDKYVYFNIKDETSTLRCFMMMYVMKQPLEDGMMVEIVTSPKLTTWGVFSLNIRDYRLVGEGSLQRAFEILRSRLEKEGLFDKSKKRSLPSVPTKIGLIASVESAAYGDFIKILNARWGGVKIYHIDVLVQGQSAAEDIVNAIHQMNLQADLPEVLIITRGGGSGEDLATFSEESVVRAVAASRIPTLVAIGHERDTSLSELAADVRASTPSNAAELLVPSKQVVIKRLSDLRQNLSDDIDRTIRSKMDLIKDLSQLLDDRLENIQEQCFHAVQTSKKLLMALDPLRPLDKGYAIVRSNFGKAQITSVKNISEADKISVQLKDGVIHTRVTDIMDV